MRRIVKRLPTPAMVVAVVALILALGGSAIAGGVLTTKKFKNQALRGPLTYVSTTTLVTTATAGGVSRQLITTCPATFAPTGGAVRTTNQSNLSNFFIFQQYPTTNSWIAQVYAGIGPGGNTAEPVVNTAICAKTKTTSGVLAPPTT